MNTLIPFTQVCVSIREDELNVKNARVVQFAYTIVYVEDVVIVVEKRNVNTNV